jgi:hypothetical protein
MLACGCVSLLLTPCLVAETLISETFAAGLDGWTVDTKPGFNAGTIAWSSLDSAGLGGSGSLAITANGAAEVVAERCLPVSEPIQNFSVSAKIMFPHVLETGGNAFLWLYTFEDGECSNPFADLGELIGFNVSPGVSDGVWTPVIVTNGSAQPNIHSVLFTVETSVAYSGTVYVDDVLMSTNVAATPQGGRFAASVAWKTPAGQIGFGNPVNLTAATSYFSFFAAANVEVILKVLNGCGVNDNYWVFAAGLTNVATLIDVEDNLHGYGIYYETAQGFPFPPIEDTRALPGCP